MIHAHYPAAQRGMVLLVGVVLLMVISIVALAGMRASILEERMAANLRLQNLALQGAEAALREGERWLAGLDANDEKLLPKDDLCAASPENCVYGLAALGGAARIDLTCADADALWQGAAVRSYDTEINDLAAAPRYLLEDLNRREPDDLSDPNAGGYSYYRLTAWAAGQGAASCVVLQTTYKKRY